MKRNQVEAYRFSEKSTLLSTAPLLADDKIHAICEALIGLGRTGEIHEN